MIFEMKLQMLMVSVMIKLQDISGVQATHLLGWQRISGTNIAANRCCWRILSGSNPAIVRFQSSLRASVNFRIGWSEIRGRRVDDPVACKQHWEEGVEDQR